MASLLSSGDLTLGTIPYRATSSDLSFDNSYYFASSNTNSNFNVYYWSGSAWSSKYTQTKSGNFGHQIACTWDGDRFVVGSPDENKVYVYHSPGGSGSQKWTHNASGVVTSPTVYTITCPDSSTTGRRFGWSVSIAKDQGNHIIIGAPGDFTQSDSDGQKRGKVYIYEFNGTTWSKTFEKTDSSAHTDVSNAGSSVSISEPEIQLKESSATSGQAFYQVNNASPQFGFYVDISGYAEYIAIGVPGTPIGLLNSTNLDGYTGTGSIDRTGGNSDYFENTSQLGCIVCYITSNTNKSWASNTSLYGKPVRGQTEMSWTSGLSGDNSSNTVIWDFTALGTTCKISLDGTRLIGGSPRYSFPGKQQSPNFGRLDAWNYSTTDSDWVLGKGRVVGNRPGNRIGMNIAIDYTGQRVVALLMKQPAVYSSGGNTGNGGIMVFDWNGNGFYEVVPEVQTNLGSSVNHEYGTVAISKGDVVAASAYDSSSTGLITFYFYKLTAGFDGNSLVGGYCAADTFLVGPNDGSTQNTFKKQIKFGGTFFDNTYDNTTIENRIYHFNQDGNDANQQGYSELIISKKTSADAPDMIRFKSNEFRIDTYVNQNNTNQFNTSADGEYDHHPALTMNIAGNFKLNAEFDTSVENTQCETKALLDVEGDIFGRRRINAGYLQGQNFLGRKWPWQILYDTRSAHTKNGNDLYSNTFNEFNSTASYKQGRLDSRGVGTSTVTHHESEGAITLSGTSTYVHNNDGNVVKSITGNGISGSLWFKLINDHSTYSSSGVTLVSYGNPLATNHTGFRLQVTNDTIRLNFGTGKIQPSTSYSFKKDKWYHIYYSFKPLVITTLSNTDLWINGVNVTLTSDGTLSNASSYIPNHYIGSPLGDSATNIYIGMVAHYNSHYYQQFHSTADNYIGQFASPTEMYNWGPPQQKLVVGGDTFIENRLSIGGTHSPDYPLDVTGDINFTGNIYQDGETFYTSPWTFNATTPPPMTSPSSGGYTVSDSSNLGTGYEGWNAFDASSSTSWATNINYLGSSTGSYYNGTTSTTYNGSLTVNGDWIQLQSSVGIITNKIDILPYSTSNEQCPRTGKLLGSNDGSTWTEIHSFTNQTYTQGQYTTISFTNTTAYSYFRLVCEDMEYVNSSTDPRTGATTYFSTVITIDEIRFHTTSSSIYYNTGNVGIGTTNPLYNLHVAGTSNFTNAIYANGSAGTSGQVLTTNGPGLPPTWTTVSGGGGGSSYWTQSGTNVYYVSGFVGIGTLSPLYSLDVDGDINFTGELSVNGSAGSAGQVLTSSGAGNAPTWTTVSGGGGGSSYWTQSGTNVYYVSGFVGIGTSTPFYSLDVDGDINFTGELSVNGSVGSAGQVLTTNGPGSAPTWTTVSGGGGGSSYWTQSGLNIYYTTGNVGIGTTTPSYTLEIDGDINFTGNLYQHGNNLWQELPGTSDIWYQSGNVYAYNSLGVGTTSPTHELDVLGDINYTGTLYNNGTAVSFGGSSVWSQNVSDIYYSSSIGKVSIGTTATTGKLTVSGSNSGANATYRFFTVNTSQLFISGAIPSWSIYASNHIGASGFYAFSDRRIKKNITDINDSSALDKIRLLEPKMYNYINEVERGTSNVYGFIAQEVANVLPYAVTIGEGDIPNIYTNSNVIVTENSNVLELHLDTPVEGLSLSNTSVINIITDKDTTLTCNVLSFSGSNVITIENTDEFSNVTNAFIKGERITDFHSLDKNAIWAVATAALQEVDRQLQAEKTKVATLETQVADLLTRVTALENN